MRILTSIILFLGFFSCKLQDTERENLKSQRVELPAQTADTIDVVYSEKGLIKLKLRAPKLVMSENAGAQFNEFPSGVQMEFYDKQGGKNADLVADYGYDDSNKRERYVKGNVVINLKDGAVYTTDELFIDEKKDSIYNNGKPVKITKPDGTLIQGDSFYSNARMDFISIKNVHDSAIPVEEDPISSSSPKPQIEE